MDDHAPGSRESVSVNIDRLVLSGIDLPPEQRGAFREALAAELSRLLAEGGLERGLAAGGAFYAAQGVDIRLADGAGTAALAAQVARSVYGGIGE
jgi:hypothetical protein